MTYTRSTFIAACIAASLTPTAADAVALRASETWLRMDPTTCWQKAHNLLSTKTKTQLFFLNLKHDKDFREGFDYRKVEEISAERGLTTAAMVGLMEDLRIQEIPYGEVAARICGMTAEEIAELNDLPQRPFRNLFDFTDNTELGTVEVPEGQDTFSNYFLSQLPDFFSSPDSFTVVYAPGKKLSEKVSEKVSLPWREDKDFEEQEADLKELIRTAYDPAPDDSPGIARMKERRLRKEHLQ